MRTEHHAFVDGDAGRCGAILRRLEPHGLRTRTVFRMGADAPLYLVDHVVEHTGDVRDWTRFTYDSPTSGTRHSGTRAPDGTVHVDGSPAPALSGAVGGYGEHLLVTRLLGGAGSGIPFRQFDEGDPGAGAHAAELRREGVEATDLLDGSVIEAERVRLVVDGRATNTHWCVDGVVVTSDWCGAQSFLVDDLDDLCAGLDPEVTARIEQFAAHEGDAPA